MTAVIVDLALPSQQFELGRILGMEGDTSVALETMVPSGERTVPFFRVHGGENHFEEPVQHHPAVNDIDVISTHDGEGLYTLDWDVAGGHVLRWPDWAKRESSGGPWGG